MIKEVLNLLLNSKCPSDVEIKESFDEVVEGMADTINASSLITLFQIDKFDDVLLSSAIVALNDGIKRINLNKPLDDTIEIKTFKYIDNFSYLYFAIDVIASCLGLFVSRSFEYDDNSTLFKIYSNLNQNNIFNNDDFFEKTGIYLNIYRENQNYFKYLSAVKKTLKFDNILSLADIFLNPFGTKNLFLGGDNSFDIEKLAKIALNLKYSNSIFINNEKNYPFILLDCENNVLEAWKNKIFSYKVTADLFNIKPFKTEDLFIKNIDEAFTILKDVFENKAQNAYFDFITLNSALAIYISKKAPSLYDAYNFSKKAILDGNAFEKYKLISNYINL